MKIHYFWVLCPNDIEQDDEFSVSIDHVTCAACLAEIEAAQQNAVSVNGQEQTLTNTNEVEFE